MELLLSFSLATAWMALAYFPGAVEAPQYAQILEAARAPVAGDNGADALYALEQLPDWPQALPRCQGEDDCLAVAREHLDAYRALPAESREAFTAYDAALTDLSRYGHFRYFVAVDDPIPPFTKLLAATSLNAYRHADGNSEAALQSACTSASVARTMLASQNTLIDSMIAQTQLLRDIRLIAQIRTEKPELPWPAACDGVQPLPREHLAVCPLLYGEWYMASALHKATETEHYSDNKIIDGASRSFMRAWMSQVEVNSAYKMSRYCEADALAAVARDEIVALEFPPEEEGKYCALFNALCRINTPIGNIAYQPRLLNAYRVLVAFDALRDSEKPLPEFLQREDGALVLHLHPDRDRATRVVLPLAK